LRPTPHARRRQTVLLPFEIYTWHPADDGHIHGWVTCNEVTAVEGSYTGGLEEFDFDPDDLHSFYAACRAIAAAIKQHVAELQAAEDAAAAIARPAADSFLLNLRPNRILRRAQPKGHS
jgi:hypothetical protein